MVVGIFVVIKKLLKKNTGVGHFKVNKQEFISQNKKEFARNKAPHCPEEPWKDTFLDLQPTRDERRPNTQTTKQVNFPSIPISYHILI